MVLEDDAREVATEETEVSGENLEAARQVDPGQGGFPAGACHSKHEVDSHIRQFPADIEGNSII